MAGATLPPGKNFALSANWGTFRGENGFAATAVARVSDNLFAHAGVGVGTERGGVGGRAGVTYAW
jgi:trimeric autotransporter adhesin